MKDKQRLHNKVQAVNPEMRPDHLLFHHEATVAKAAVFSRMCWIKL
jgi:hypothetical protein